MVSIETTKPALVSENPSTGETVAEFPVHDADAVRAAVASAREAASWWRDQDFDGRKRHLLRWASWLVRNADQVCALVHAENGKPLDDAYLELLLALEHIRWSARHAGKVLKPERVAPGLLMANFAATIERRPHGVVGVIGPWNYPTYTPVGSIAYALAAGNTVVFKPSELTTAVGSLLAESFAAANPDAPAGVFSVITGYGETGAALVSSDTDMIAFTGSTATGKKIAAEAGRLLKPVILECGGKDALLVDADADIPAAAEAAAFGAMSNGGQTCVGVERVYVHKAVSDEFVERLTAELAEVRAGTSYGPMTMPAQLDVVRAHIAEGLASGGSAVVGGTECVRAPYVEPVVLIGVDESASVVQEETFGPMLTVRTVDSMDEAAQLANDTPYGLASTVFSRGQGEDLARRLRAGATSVNAVFGFAAIPALPFGGVGDSGVGRIHGAEGLRGFTRTHAIARQRFAIPGMALLSFRRSPAVLRLIKRFVRLRHG